MMDNMLGLEMDQLAKIKVILSKKTRCFHNEIVQYSQD